MLGHMLTRLEAQSDNAHRAAVRNLLETEGSRLARLRRVVGV